MIRLKRNMWFMIWTFVLMFVSLIGFTSYQVFANGPGWLKEPYNSKRISAQIENIIPGDIYDKHNLIMAGSNEEGKRTYPQSETARYANAHLLGDQYAITAGGVEFRYNPHLYGLNLNLIDRTYQAFQAEKNKGNDIYLSVDSDLNKYIYEQIGSYRGSAVVINYKTGEIIGSVSKPSYDIATIQDLDLESLSAEEGVLNNRATMGLYPPGSTFKVITATSALENLSSAESITFNSESSIEINNSKIPNYDGKSHGNIKLEKALEVSSNTYFAQLAKQLGGTNLTKTANQFGFNDNFSFSDLSLQESKYSSGSSDNQLAWSAVGQHEDLATPQHMAMIAGAIANDGTMMKPKLLKDVKNSLGMSIYYFRSEKYKEATTQGTARKMQNMMINVVENGTGTGAKVSGYTIGGKTGSAETDKGTHAWFIGFVHDDDNPYAIAVILENAGTGGTHAAPVAGKILTRLLNG